MRHTQRINPIKTSFLKLCIVASSVLATPLYANPNVSLDQFFTTVNSLQGQFTQQVFNRRGKRIQQSSGRLLLARPGRFRWTYTRPSQQEVISDGKSVWIYDKDLQQVMIKPISHAISGTPLYVLMRKQKPSVNFVVSRLPARKDRLNWYKLTPRKPNNNFVNLQVAVDNQANIRKMLMLDKLGQKTLITISARKNVPIRGGDFFFNVPKGVDVVGQRQR